MRTTLLVSVALLVFSVGTARGEAVLDQASLVTVGFSAAVFGPDPPSHHDSFRDLAQTFTVGISGQLTQVDIFVFTRGDPPGDLLLDVRTVTGGQPDALLGSASVTAAEIEALPDRTKVVRFDLVPENLFVTRGELLAVTLMSRDSPIADDYFLDGSNENPYPGGMGLERTNLTAGWVEFDIPNADPDFAFRTFVVPDAILVDVDVKPGADPNPVNPMSRGVIPVAILGSEAFRIADVDASTLAFGPGGARLAHRNGPHVKDANRDRSDDLLGHFRTQESGIAFGATEACVTGELLDGTPFEGCDAIQTVPACGLGHELALLLPGLAWLRRRRRRAARADRPFH